MFLALDTLDIVANVEFSMLGRLWTRRGIGSVDEGVVASVAG